VNDQSNTSGGPFPDGRRLETGQVEPDCVPAPNVPRAISPRRRLPPSQFRSRGESLNYAEWSERERFMELDKAIRPRRQEDHHVEDQTSPDDLP